MTTLQETPPLAGYAPDREVPLGGYAALMTLFGTIAGGAVAGAVRSGRGIPSRVPFRDIALIGIATHKLARTLAKDKVTAPLRAPLTRLQDSAGMGEVKEEVRVTGVKRALGDLVLCPYCLSAWFAMGLFSGYLYSPAAVRLIASTFTAISISDFLQIGYKAAQNRM
jgi:hypothetical protein